jgi:hypothetical protein
MVAISDDDSPSDIDPDASSDDDGCCSEDEKHRPSARKNSDGTRLRSSALRVYKEEGKAWKWIFKNLIRIKTDNHAVE